MRDSHRPHGGRIRRLNPQGLARRDLLVSFLVPDPGNVVVSIDLASGEPSVTAEYSGDPRYRYATVDGVGKRPYWDGDVLMISDIYLMTASVSPIGRDLMRATANESWCDRWLTDEAACKKPLKKMREIVKMLCLALGYGMQPKKMVKQCREHGFLMDLATAKAFYEAYWRLFSGVRRLADSLAAVAGRDRQIINQFGFRMTPEPRLAFNYTIQSSVSGIINVFCAKLFAIAPWAHLLTIIHDELLVEVPEARLQEFRTLKEAANLSLNEDLAWSVPIRCGWAVGKNWLEAK